MGTRISKIEITTTHKRCCTCKEMKPFSDFSKTKYVKWGMHYSCKACNTKKARESYEKNKTKPEFKERERARWIKQDFGITMDEYFARFTEQGGKCATCGIELVIDFQKNHKAKAALDHSHKNGNIRKFLCPACNYIIGRADENITTFENIIKYIKEFETGDHKKVPFRRTFELDRKKRKKHKDFD